MAWLTQHGSLCRIQWIDPCIVSTCSEFVLKPDESQIGTKSESKTSTLSWLSEVMALIRIWRVSGGGAGGGMGSEIFGLASIFREIEKYYAIEDARSSTRQI